MSIAESPLKTISLVFDSEKNVCRHKVLRERVKVRSKERSVNVYQGVKTKLEENKNNSLDGESSRGPETANGLPKFIHLGGRDNTPIQVSRFQA